MASTTLPRCACNTCTMARLAGQLGAQLDLPDPLAAIATVLLQDTRAGRSKPRRECLAKGRGRAVEMGVGAPAKMLRAIQDLFHAHLEDHVGMRADPGTARRHVTQHRVKRLPCLAFVDRIDPDQHAIGRQQAARAPRRQSHRHRLRVPPGRQARPTLRRRDESGCSAVSRHASPRDRHAREWRSCGVPC